ncbi:MAG: UV DNA damage repair endonuclease UvsE [Acidobacteria bacterium]|jgi:UV DNA damage endonuclease|nr:UV DNA damage repair endonuclease UvsE [Acidobacteriota bacterium]
MRIGYPCLNRSLGCTPSRTFRLASYSPGRLVETVRLNLDCLGRVLEYNRAHGLLFFRITSDLVPFASHPVCAFPWHEEFAPRFAELGNVIRSGAMRISMHPDQFTLINSPDEDIFRRSAAELAYHARVLDLLELDGTARIQVHAGGVYNDKPAAIDRFCRRFERLGEAVRRRLTVENDDRLYTVADCLQISRRTGVPVLFDSFHHQLHNRGEEAAQALGQAAATWKKGDGPPMIDYSSQKKGERAGRHAESIDLKDFARFIAAAGALDFDIMLEIKDKEKSALRARRQLVRMKRIPGS